MKKILLLVFIMSSLFVFADKKNKALSSRIADSFKEDVNEQIGAGKTTVEAKMASDFSSIYNAQGANEVPTGTLIGSTIYDLQSNYGVCRRVTNSPSDLFYYGGWTMSQVFNDDSYPDRGTGFNYMGINNENWQPQPSNRIEPTLRTGWPNIGMFDHGRMFSLTHSNAGLLFTHRTGNQNQWEEIPITVDADAVWARSAFDGDTLHVVTGRLNSVFAGVDGGLNYLYSTDAGLTWNIGGPLEPDYAESYHSMGADSYQIDAQNGKVAVIFGSLLTDLVIYESDDLGLNWSKRTLASSSNPTLTYDPVDGFYVEPYWGSYGNVSVIYDSSDVLHAVYAGALQFNTADNDFLSSNQFFPIFESTALWYWNENMSAPEIIGETVTFDADADGNLGNDFYNYDEHEVSLYSGIVCHPQLGIDDQDNLFISYTANINGNWQPENVTVLTSTDSGNTIVDHTEVNPANRITYTDVFLIKTPDQGDTWEGPVNVTNGPATDDVYASIPRNIGDDEIRLIYQCDSLAGTFLHEDQSVQTINHIAYVGVDPTEVNNSLAAPDSEPYVLPIVWDEPYEISQGCAISNDLFLEGYLYALDYPDGFVEPLFVGDIDYSIPGDYTEVIIAIDSQGNVSDSLYYDITVVVDTIAPVMEFDLDCPTVTVIAGTDWNPLLPNIIDDSTCSLESLLQIQNNVDTDVIGDYLVTYNVTDFAGNAATPVSLTVNVISVDNAGPVIDIGAINDSIPQFNILPILDVSAFDDVDCGNITLEIEGYDDIETGIIGVYPVTVTATDQSGNQTVLEIDFVVYDGEAPAISFIQNPINFSELDCGTDNILTFDELPEDLIELSDNYTAVEDLELNYVFPDIDCSIPGNYEIEFIVTDEAGNTADSDLLISIVNGLEIVEVEPSIVMHPNPVKGDHVEVEKEELMINRIQILDIRGSLIRNIEVETLLTARFSLDISGIGSGIYFVRFETEKGAYAKKLMVNR